MPCALHVEKQSTILIQMRETFVRMWPTVF